MDHRYIDDHRVADRYLDNTLSPPERLKFEAHLVDCQECPDRLLLAEMFHHGNGALHQVNANPADAEPLPADAKPAPQSLRLVFGNRRFWPWQLLLLLAGAAAVVVLSISALLLLVSRR